MLAVPSRLQRRTNHPLMGLEATSKGRLVHWDHNQIHLYCLLFCTPSVLARLFDYCFITVLTICWLHVFFYPIYIVHQFNLLVSCWPIQLTVSPRNQFTMHFIAVLLNHMRVIILGSCSLVSFSLLIHHNKTSHITHWLCCPGTNSNWNSDQTRES